jgi:osmotically-inducible protein OsmY
MFHKRTHSFTRAVITGGLLSLAVATTDTYAAQATKVQATKAQAPQAQAAQPQVTPDAELAAKIRKAIADDKAIAAYSQTLKIVVSDGLVSLKGSVKSDADKKAIGAKADAIAGEKNVMNNLQVNG